MCCRVFLSLLLCLSLIPVAQGATPAERLTKKSDEWFMSDEGRTALANVLSWQTKNGDWPKNTDTTGGASGSKKQSGTFDNGATVGELRLLARAWNATGDEAYKLAFLRGLDHVLAAQYEHGGWPQSFPLSDRYPRHVTFNDGTMIRILELLRDVAADEDFEFVGKKRVAASSEAVRLGIECILKCQIRVDGQLTVWCAQHHAETLRPVLARSYEHPSLSGSESAGIVRFLMRLENPSHGVIRSVDAATQWFASSKIEGYQYERRDEGPALFKDVSAEPIWARFYEIETNRPIFSDRDGVIKYDILEIGSERRGGYSWYGNWGNRVLATYSSWPHRNRVSREN